MKDRYLFKAKTARIVDTYNNAEDGVWVKGSLKEDCGKYTIFQFEFDRADYVPYEVDPDTICQCTGLKDKNGNLIWENDIVKHYNDGAHPESYCTGTVLWDENYAGFYRTSNEYGLSKPRISSDCIYEVVGNVFDNMELLEE